MPSSGASAAGLAHLAVGELGHTAVGADPELLAVVHEHVARGFRER